MSSSMSSSTFVEGLVYSQQGSGKHNTFGSLARRTQKLGAELCGRLSQVVLQQPWCMTESSSASPAVASEPSPSFISDVQRDLSAHYGSHALRRGLAKPFGPCVRPLLRKGKLCVARAGVHGPRYMRVWKLCRARRCWCPRCGVWLTRGVGATAQQSEKWVLPTVMECRVRQRGALRCHRRCRGASNASPCRKFTVCCVRCFNEASRAATLAAGKQPFDGADTIEPAQRRVQPIIASTADAREKRRRSAEQAVAAVVAAARVPKRNRRFHRRSARRPRKEEQAARGGKLKELSSSATAAHLRQTLAASLTTKKTARDASLAAAGATTTPSAPLARASQKKLRSLVPSGPLKKVNNASHSGGSAPVQLPNAKLCSVAPSPAAAPPSQPPLRATLDTRKEHRHTADATTPHRVVNTAKVVKSAASTAKGEKSTANSSSESPPPPSPATSKSSEGPAKAAAAASSSPLVPKGPPMKAMPKKAVRAPVKAQTKASGTAKLMDAMNQLGF
ncbi:hypothetical protein ABB37_07528 [Leptomonas pyrrhocoris]|uniref:Uncharacterized protein n=1 Tax=Leptomonas pyrrhocoris TaxID=157538 RepID=A0A0M9FV94_LEPPY|nr:hypothetical protein ABB37_07528 [Leptomonas pyrrhocoris]KPA76679.1 hypothetical protein ABB37_07528 [Leptomonas pyrrhocoris]|eukprot:XP_015655118.1 hypothetical protein ABB37_07528 [Leptomonas pyrrhocoris]